MKNKMFIKNVSIQYRELEKLPSLKAVKWTTSYSVLVFLNPKDS